MNKKYTIHVYIDTRVKTYDFDNLPELRNEILGGLGLSELMNGKYNLVRLYEHGENESWITGEACDVVGDDLIEELKPLINDSAENYLEEIKPELIRVYKREILDFSPFLEEIEKAISEEKSSIEVSKYDSVSGNDELVYFK